MPGKLPEISGFWIWGKSGQVYELNWRRGSNTRRKERGCDVVSSGLTANFFGICGYQNLAPGSTSFLCKLAQNSFERWGELELPVWKRIEELVSNKHRVFRLARFLCQWTCRLVRSPFLSAWRAAAELGLFLRDARECFYPALVPRTPTWWQYGENC